MFARRFILVAMLIPSAAHAQNARADALNQKAQSLYEAVSRRGEAARIHMEEARVRGARDPKAVDALMIAAHLFGYANENAEATNAMEAAGYRALMIGDVEKASSSFILAALFAEKEKDFGRMQQLGVKAYLLADSPLLTVAQQQAIRGRFETSRVLADLVK